MGKDALIVLNFKSIIHSTGASTLGLTWNYGVI